MLNLNNTKKIWEGINGLISDNKSKRKRTISSIRCPNSKRVFTDPGKVSDVLNTHFATVEHKLASVIPQAKYDFRKYLPASISPSSFLFDPITPQEIQEFPVRILKCASAILSVPLARSMNLSIETGSFPSKLKHAKVIPIYKNGDELEPGNYRPISLLSNINRVFEKLVYTRIICTY